MQPVFESFKRNAPFFAASLIATGSFAAILRKVFESLLSTGGMKFVFSALVTFFFMSITTWLLQTAHTSNEVSKLIG